jgi:hypothetical protein
LHKALKAPAARTTTDGVRMTTAQPLGASNQDGRDEVRWRAVPPVARGVLLRARATCVLTRRFRGPPWPGRRGRRSGRRDGRLDARRAAGVDVGPTVVHGRSRKLIVKVVVREVPAVVRPVVCAELGPVNEALDALVKQAVLQHMHAQRAGRDAP